MAYTIFKADGTPVVIADNAIDTAFYNSTGGSGGVGQGVQLVGRNTINYGAATAQNFLQLTENFASSLATFPSDTTALQGQLWFNKLSTTTGDLYVRIAEGTGLGVGLANWQKLVTVSASGNATVPGNLVVTGTITSNTHTVPVTYSSVPVSGAIDGDQLVIGSVISIYAGGAWKQIFPAIFS
jgi:hypothetical protein